MSGTSMSVCVFCGARNGVYESEIAEARALGRALAEAGHHLVYGAGGVGLMGHVAQAAHENGGSITGVIPTFLFERERGDAAPVDHWVVTDDMFERKREMIARADVFIALPGGFGTLDEVLEIASLNYLQEISKPLVLLSSTGYWTDFVNMVRNTEKWGFAELDPALILTAGSAQEALQLITRQPQPL